MNLSIVNTIVLAILVGAALNCSTHGAQAGSIVAGYKHKKQQEIIDHLSNVSLSADDGYDLLNFAAGHSKTRLLQFLINKGLDVNYKPEGDGFWTPLDWAVGCGALESVKMLLSHGARVSDGGALPFLSTLDIALARKDPKMTELILKVNPGTENVFTSFGDTSFGETSLHRTARKLGKLFENDEQTMTKIGYLVAHGANRCARDEFGRTAHDLIKRYHRSLIRRKSHDYKRDNSWSYEFVRCEEDVVYVD